MELKSASHKGRPVNWAYEHFVYPMTKPSVYRGFSRLVQKYADREKQSLEQALEMQWRDLSALLKHAYETTGFYRERFDAAGIKPSKISSPSDLKNIPLLTREDIRKSLPLLRSNRFKDEEIVEAATGGTTDTPVPLLRSVQALREKNAVQWRFNNWAGFYPGDKVFYLWGARQDYNENPSWRWRLYDRHLMRQVWAPTSLFNEEVMDSFRKTLNQLKPRIIYAYPTPLALFCEFLKSSGRPYSRPVSAICTAEPLFDHQRKLMTEVLDCPIFEHYGSRDFAMIAAECEHHKGLHLNTAAAYVEFIPVQGAEVEGLHELLVTDLLNYGMPMIRYRINDCTLLQPEQCTCGRSYPLLKQIVGRSTDIFYLRDGTVVPGISLQNRVIGVCPGINKMQVIQKTLDDFILRYVPGQTFQPKDLELLKVNLAKYFSNKVGWTFQQVPQIDREPSGKTRFCVSYVTRPTPDESGKGLS